MAAGVAFVSMPVVLRCAIASSELGGFIVADLGCVWIGKTCGPRKEQPRFCIGSTHTTARHYEGGQGYCCVCCMPKAKFMGASAPLRTAPMRMGRFVDEGI